MKKAIKLRKDWNELLIKHFEDKMDGRADFVKECFEMTESCNHCPAHEVCCFSKAFDEMLDDLQKKGWLKHIF